MHEAASPRPRRPVTRTALSLAVDAAVACEALVKGVTSHREQRLQLIDSSASAAANLAESDGRRGKARKNHRRIAHGSIQEAKTWIELLVGYGVVDVAKAREAWRLLDQAGALTWTLLGRG